MSAAAGNGVLSAMANRYLDYDDDDEGAFREGGRGRRFTDFDCPECNANNPRDEPFGDGDEILCYYCGAELRARVNEDGRLRLLQV